ncbi:MAG: hypothetical protein ACI9RO_002290, partial [Alteromonas macleodii]
MEQYFTSIGRLKELPVETVNGGHFPSNNGACHHKIITKRLRAKGVRNFLTDRILNHGQLQPTAWRKHYAPLWWTCDNDAFTRPRY